MILKTHMPSDSIDAIALANGVDGERVDWILTRGFDVKGGGVTAAGPSDHPYYWVDITIAME